jgi:hypothetical protein
MSEKQKHTKNYFEADHLSELSVSLVVESVLNKSEKDLPNDIKEHLQECQECKQSVIESLEIVTDEEIEKIYSTKSHRDNKVIFLKKENQPKYFNWIKIAASIVFVVSIGTIGIIINKKKPNLISNIETDSLAVDSPINQKENNEYIVEKIEQEIEQPKDTIVVSKDINQKELIAKADFSGDEYKLSVYQEAMLGNTMRSNYFKVISPVDSVKYTTEDTILFNWNTDIELEAWLMIYNNNEDLIFKSEPSVNTFYEFTSERKKGIYLWQLETEEDIIYTGVFFIK